MIVKMLTHVHLCGTHFVVLAHFEKEVEVLKGRERMGSSLPPAELARRDLALFEKMKCIFSITPVGSLEKSRECHRT